MKRFAQDIKRLEQPRNIREAVFASSAYVLRKAFQSDPTVQGLVRAGKEIVPLIEKELKKGERLPEITRACCAYILQNVDLEAARRILPPLLKRSLKGGGVFFPHFAAHALRQGAGLSIKPLEIFYTPAEMIEALGKVSNAG